MSIHEYAAQIYRKTAGNIFGAAARMAQQFF